MSLEHEQLGPALGRVLDGDSNDATLMPRVASRFETPCTMPGRSTLVTLSSYLEKRRSTASSAVRLSKTFRPRLSPSASEFSSTRDLGLRPRDEDEEGGSPPRMAMRLSSRFAPAPRINDEKAFTSPGRSGPTAVTTRQLRLSRDILPTLIQSSQSRASSGAFPGPLRAVTPRLLSAPIARRHSPGKYAIFAMMASLKIDQDHSRGSGRSSGEDSPEPAALHLPGRAHRQEGS